MKQPLLFLILSSVLFQLPSAGALSLGGDGVVTAGDAVAIRLVHFSPDWRANRFASPPKDAPDAQAVSGEHRAEWMIGEENGSVGIGWRKGERGSKAFRYEVGFPDGVPAAELALEITLPLREFSGGVISLGKDKVPLPEIAGKADLYAGAKVASLEIPLESGRLRIKIPDGAGVKVMDNRLFQQYDYTIRIAFPLQGGMLRSSSLEFTAEILPYRMEPLDLGPAANSGFIDDGDGGWTGQGPDNDLRALASGRLNCGGVRFEVAEGDAACIVLGNTGQKEFSRGEALPVPQLRASNLYLLHASAWLPPEGTVVGTVVVHYANGSRQEFPVVAGREIGNWHFPSGQEKARVAWSGSTGDGTRIGLYCTAFPLRSLAVVRVQFRASGQGVWMIAAATLGDAPFRGGKDPVQVTAAGDNWRKFPPAREIEPDSALDFSFLLDPPAGKHGFVEVRGDKFVFAETGIPVRFHGANIAFDACFPPREQAEAIAERIARSGYNAIRFHHFDGILTEKDSVALRPDKLDRLEYFIAKLKERGVYISLDFYTIRTGHNGLAGGNYKLAVMLRPEYRDDLKEFIRNLMTRVNPYTGLAWRDDPVFNSFSIINENTILHGMSYESAYPVAEEYRREFLARRGGAPVPEEKVERDRAFRRFVLEVYREYFEDMRTFLRELGIKAPVTDQNFIPSPSLVPQRLAYDYVDNHLYWDHADSYQAPFRIRNTSVLTDRLRNPREITPSRIFGKPFAVTEWNYCYPNACRAEAGPLFGAYAAFQDWDAIYRFTYCHKVANYFEENGIEMFEGVNDVIQMLTERIAAAFFLRGDVSVAADAYPVVVPAEAHLDYRENYPRGAQELFLLGRSGSVVYRGPGTFEPELPQDTKAVYAMVPRLDAGGLPVLRDGDVARPNQILSSTGELAVNFSDRTFVAVTPRSEALVLPAGGKLAGSRLAVENGNTFGVVAMIALGEEELAQAERFLILHLTDVQLEGMKYHENAAGNRVYLSIHNPAGSLLARRGTADIRIAFPDGEWRLHALDLCGRRIREVPVEAGDDHIRFTADTFGAEGALIFAYELIREWP